MLIVTRLYEYLLYELVLALLECSAPAQVLHVFGLADDTAM